MVTYYIYHIRGIKIGCTKNLIKRMREQGFTEWEILETHTDGWLAGDREIELQKEYGLPVDTVHYMVALQNSGFGSSEVARLGANALTHEQRVRLGKIVGRMQKGKPKPYHVGLNLQKQKVCHVCNKQVNAGNYERFHGDKCKQSPENIKEMIAKHATGNYSYRALAEEYELGISTVGRIIKSN